MSMSVEEAFLKLQGWWRDYRYDSPGVHGNVIAHFMPQRGLEPCPYCGASMAMGLATVAHKDGRSVTFELSLFHSY